MNVNRAKKEKLVREINDTFENHDNFYLLDFQKMPVAKAVELRKKFKEQEYTFKVVKNRLALRALPEEFPETLRDCFQGPTAIASSETDAIGLARMIKDFASQYKVISVKAGVIEGQYLDQDRFAEIAALTSKTDLIAKIGFLMAYPLTQLLRTLKAPLTSLGSLMSQLEQKK